MQCKKILMAAALVMLGASCSNIERSRNLSDPLITARTLAEQVCSNCHGIDGNSVSPTYPRLAGQQAAYIVSQLTNFRGHQRSDPAGIVRQRTITMDAVNSPFTVRRSVAGSHCTLPLRRSMLAMTPAKMSGYIRRRARFVSM